MILVLNYKQNNGLWMSLVSCESCEHIGLKERVCWKSNVLRKGFTSNCQDCCIRMRTGVPLTEGIRRKISIGNKGKIMTQASKDKVSKANKGKKRTEEFKRALGLIVRARPPLSAEGRKKISLALTGKKHSQERRLKTSGPKNWRWNPNITDEQRAKNKIRFRDEEFDVWSLSVKRRDNFTCQITGEKSGDIVSHHLNAWAKFSNERYDINNGITIRRDLHDLFHKYYGNGDNTREQFEEFLTWIGLTLTK